MICERNINWLPLICSQLGTWPTTQACALTGNQTGDLLVFRMMHDPLSHTSQGISKCFSSQIGEDYNWTEVVLLVEIGFLCWVMGNAFWEPIRRRTWGKIYWSENKGLPPGAQCLIHNQVAQLHLTVGPLGPHEAQAEVQDPELLCH